jgi:hypothetical protein
MSSLAPWRLSSLFIRPAVSRTVPVYTKTLRVHGNITASRSSSVSGFRPLRLPTGLSLPAPQPLVNRSQLHTSGMPRPSRILRPIGHRRTRSSSPRSTCVLCRAPAPSPPHAASGVSLQSDSTVLEIQSALVPVLEDVKVDEPAREITTETAVALTVKVDVPLGGCTSRNGGICDSDRAGKRRRSE